MKRLTMLSFLFLGFTHPIFSIKHSTGAPQLDKVRPESAVLERLYLPETPRAQQDACRKELKKSIDRLSEKASSVTLLVTMEDQARCLDMYIKMRNDTIERIQEGLSHESSLLDKLSAKLTLYWEKRKKRRLAAQLESIKTRRQLLATSIHEAYPEGAELS